MRKFSAPGPASACASPGGRSMVLWNCVTPIRALLVRRGVTTLSHPATHWLVLSALMLPADGISDPPKPPKFVFSLRVQRKNVRLLPFTFQSPRMFCDFSVNGAANVVTLGKNAEDTPMAESSCVFSKLPKKNSLSLIA